jgi:DNA-binding CsgD family transcriptional regulator
MDSVGLISADEVRLKAVGERLRPLGIPFRTFTAVAEFRTHIKQPVVGGSPLALYVPPPLKTQLYVDELIALRSLRGDGVGAAVICMSTEEPLIQSTKVLGLPTIFYDSAVDLGTQIRSQLSGKALAKETRGTSHELTPREQSVLTGLKAGLSLKEISANLGISPNTTSTYKARLMQKLGYANNAQLIRGNRTND